MRRDGARGKRGCYVLLSVSFTKDILTSVLLAVPLKFFRKVFEKIKAVTSKMHRLLSAVRKRFGFFSYRLRAVPKLSGFLVFLHCSLACGSLSVELVWYRSELCPT